MRLIADILARMAKVQPADNYATKTTGTAAPWAVTLNDRDWFGATDGCVAVLVAADVGEAPRLSERVATVMQGWFSATESEPVSLSDLAVFANAGAAERHCASCDDKRTFTCDECHGVQGAECECESCGDVHRKTTCDLCDGTGLVACLECSDLTESKQAEFRGQVVNRQLIRVVLETLGVMDGSARLSKLPRDVFALIEDAPSPAWMAVFMPMRRYDGDSYAVAFEKPETWRPKSLEPAQSADAVVASATK